MTASATPCRISFLCPPACTGALDANQAAACNYLLALAASWLQTFNQDVYLGKADWHISSKELLSVRVNSQRFNGANLEFSGPTVSNEHTGASNVITDTISGQLTSTLSQRLDRKSTRLNSSHIT